MMNERRRQIEALLEQGENDKAIERLCLEGPPCQAWELAFMARAYFQRGDSRGDLFGFRFFAERATDEGFEEPWLEVLWDKLPDEEAETDLAHDKTKYPFNALSVRGGVGDAPRDLDWAARNVPCQAACPAGTNIPEYLTAIFDGDHERAYRINLESNVFPGVLGRVCARPCEAKCRHGWDGLGQPVAICFSKRAAADHVARPVELDNWFPASGKRVAVVGAGVAGLSLARDLARCGHEVTVFERHDVPGGMMNQGIPAFRLPREIIDREIDQVRALGVRILCGIDIGRDRSLSELVGEYDAVVLAAGTLRPNLLDLPGKDLEGIRHGLDFLLEVNSTGRAPIGEKVIVIGGGFTAMDCARTAKRLVAGSAQASADDNDLPVGTLLRADGEAVKVWYRRTEKEMLITPGELEELRHEQIDMEFLVSPVRYMGENGKVTGVEFIRNELGEPDASGRRRPVPVEGSEFVVPADTVLLATGQFPETAWVAGERLNGLLQDDGWPANSAQGVTPVEGVFFAGDFAQGASSLISAIGHAREVAVGVDAYLMGQPRLSRRVEVADAGGTGRIVEMDAVPLQEMPTLPVKERTLEAEVETGYDESLAVEETQRCYRCHYKYEIDSDKCIYCDWCIRVKPRPECIMRIKALQYDEAGRIVGWEPAANTDDTYLVWINQYDCIRCGACLAACPVDAISLQKVDLQSSPCAPEAPQVRERVTDGGAAVPPRREI